MFGIEKLERRIEFTESAQTNLVKTIFALAIAAGITPKKFFSAMNDRKSISKFSDELNDLMAKDLVKKGVNLKKEVEDLEKSLGKKMK